MKVDRIFVYLIVVYVILSSMFIYSLVMESYEDKIVIENITSDLTKQALKIDEQGLKIEEMSYHIQVLEKIGVSIEVVQKYDGFYDVSSVEFK